MRLALSPPLGACKLRHNQRRLSAYLATFHTRYDDSQIIERAAAKDEMRMKLNFQGLTLDPPLAKSKCF